MKNEQAIKNYLEQPFCDPNIKSDMGLTPLKLAITLGDISIINTLIAHPRIEVTSNEVKLALQQKYMTENSSWDVRSSGLFKDLTRYEKDKKMMQEDTTNKIYDIVSNVFLKNTGEKGQLIIKELEDLTQTRVDMWGHTPEHDKVQEEALKQMVPQGKKELRSTRQSLVFDKSKSTASDKKDDKKTYTKKKKI